MPSAPLRRRIDSRHTRSTRPRSAGWSCVASGPRSRASTSRLPTGSRGTKPSGVFSSGGLPHASADRPPDGRFGEVLRVYVPRGTKSDHTSPKVVEIAPAQTSYWKRKRHDHRIVGRKFENYRSPVGAGEDPAVLSRRLGMPCGHQAGGGPDLA